MATTEQALKKLDKALGRVGLGIAMAPTPDFTAWEQQGVELAKTGQTQKWALADWLAAGDTQWGGRAYDRAQQLFPDLSRKYLYGLAYVGRNVSLTVRQAKLSFAHHELVASLEPTEQEEILQKAVTNGWCVSELRKRLRDRLRKDSPWAVSLDSLLFHELSQYSRMVNVTPEALVARAVRLFLASPPADLAEQYEAEVLACREKDRKTREACDRQLELRQVEGQKAIARSDFSTKATQVVNGHQPFLDDIKNADTPAAITWRELKELFKTTPHVPVETLQAKLDELKVLLHKVDMDQEAARAAEKAAKQSKAEATA
jgi:hypothetical protein